MKKNVLMIVAICLLALPTQANNLAEQLCEDETFVSFVKESEAVKAHLAGLDANAREEFMKSEEMSCFVEKLESQIKNVSRILGAYPGNWTSIINAAIVQVVAKNKIAVTKNCYSEYMMQVQWCHIANPPPNPGQPYNVPLQECLALALMQYQACQGGVE